MIVPILQLHSNIIASLRVEMSDTDMEQFQQEILVEVDRVEATGLILDISAMDIIDSYMARVLNDTTRMARLLGTTVVVVGMSPSVALTLTQMGRQLIHAEAALNLEIGLSKLSEMGRPRTDT